MGSSITVIIKPTHGCNLSCKYCCVEKGAEHGRMSLRTLEKAIEQVMRLPGRDRIRWIWHGGEPALMGQGFYEEVVKLQLRYRNEHLLSNGVQSNATLIDDRFLDFLLDNNFGLTTSLDGPEEIHNLTRVYPDGRGSFSDVWSFVQEVRKRRINKGIKNGRGANGIGVICVLSKNNINFIERIYEFFRENKMAFKLNPIINVGRAADDPSGLAIGESDYGIALVKLFNKWFYEKDVGFDVNPLSDILRALVTNQVGSCQFGRSCRESFISIGPLGDVYPCGRFGGVKEYWLGNINEKSLIDIIRSEKHQKMDIKSKVIDDCKNCDYQKLCNSGCMYNAYLGNGAADAKDPYCASYKLLFECVNSALKHELTKANWVDWN